MSKSFVVPSSFSLAGQTYNVKLVPSLADHGCAGQICYEKGEIRISSELTNNDYVAITFFHEFIHALFHAVGKSDLRTDEGLVDSMAALMWQFYKTVQFDNEEEKN